MTTDPRDFTTFTALFRVAAGWDRDAEFVEAIEFDAGELSERLLLTPDELSAAVRAWAQERGDPARTVELTRSEADIGASAVGLALTVTFIAGVTAEVALEELVRFVRDRLFAVPPELKPLRYLLSLDDGLLVDELRARVARATDRRSSDLETVQMQRARDEVSGVFDTATGARYVIRVTGDLYRIAEVRRPDR